MSGKFWNYIIWGYFLSSTISVVMLVEFIMFNFPYITLFLCIFIAVLYGNLKRFKRLPNVKF